MESKNEVQLVLLRHGESQWNHENRFTGWTDVGLTQKGYDEAAQAAKKLVELKISFDHCYCSVLKRSILTLWTTLENMNLTWLPVTKVWQLNERHYGALQGLNKQETREKYGDEQVHIWRRSFDVRPPALETKNTDQDQILKYKALGLQNMPTGESLEDTLNRVLPYWNQSIVPQVKQSKKLLIVAHGNSLRSLIMQLEGLSEDSITSVEIDTAIPVIYTLNTQTLEVLDKTILK